MSKSLYEIVSYDEFLRMGYQLKSPKKALRDEATKVLTEYQVWQRGLLTDETAETFERAVERWRNIEKDVL